MNRPDPEIYSPCSAQITDREPARRAISPAACSPRGRKTRIVATLGPASSSPEIIRKMYVAGSDVFRINMSHGDQLQKTELFEAIRALEQEFDRPTTILVDLQGPKLRVGRFGTGAVYLEQGATFSLDLDPSQGNSKRVCLPHPELFGVLEPGTRLLVDDGKIILLVQSLTRDRIVTRVEVGGRLSDKKGVNAPDVVVPLPALTAKDKADLAFALEMGADWIALSFVQRPADVEEARSLIGDQAALLAKIEKPSAIADLKAIIELCDGVMVARGDLGVELPPERLPPIQKEIVHMARLAGRPVIVATQMLESMVSAPAATRAEVSDVATAIYDGADAIMLSAESAAGAWPVESVELLDRIARSVESDPRYRELLSVLGGPTDPTAANRTFGPVVAAGAALMARAISANTIACFTASGASASRIARERPQATILVATPNLRVARKLGLLWGAHAVCVPDIASFDEMIDRGVQEARRANLASPGDPLLIIAGVPFGNSGSTNVLHLAQV